jgi:hypothetical protein
MSWKTWLKELRNKHPAPHLLHHWQGDRPWCAACGSKDRDDAVHLVPSSTAVTIQDVLNEWEAARAWRTHSGAHQPGSLLALAAAVFTVDDGAVVYTARDQPGMVFIEVSNKAHVLWLKEPVEWQRCVGVQVIVVGWGVL